MTDRGRGAPTPEALNERWRRAVQAALALCAVFTAANVVLLLLNWDTATPGGLSGSAEFVAAVAYASVAGAGAAMARRRPDNLAGYAFLASGVLMAGSAFCSEYGTYAILTAEGSLPAARFVTWVGAWGWWLGAGLGLAFGSLLYPDGRLPSPRWRAPAIAAAISLALLTVLHAVTPGRLDGEYAIAVNPFGIGPEGLLRGLRGAGWLLLTAIIVVGIAALVRRVRRATVAERRQLQWLLIPGVAAFVAAPLWGLSTSSEEGPSSASQFLVVVAVFGTPTAVALAVQRATRTARSLERLVLAREEERRRIRRDLHDGLGPTLAGVALQLDVARGLVRRDPGATEALLDRLVGQVKTGIGDVRRIIDDLRPPVLDQLGLVSAIREATAHLAGSADSAARLEVTVDAGGNLRALPPATEVTAFRIVMEAVTNASRHAQARHCAIHLAADRALEVRVEDDGRGLTQDRKPGVGLTSMGERARELGGSCTIEPRPGGGTVVRASLPIGS